MAGENKRMTERLNGKILTPNQVAEIMQLSRATIIRRFQDGTIEAKLIGNKWRCPSSAVDKFFQSA